MVTTSQGSVAGPARLPGGSAPRRRLARPERPGRMKAPIVPGHRDLVLQAQCLLVERFIRNKHVSEGRRGLKFSRPGL